MKYLALFFSCLILLGCNKQSEVKPKQNAPIKEQKAPAEPVKVRQVTENEQHILDAIFEDDLDVFLNGGDNFYNYTEGLEKYTAQEIVKIYEKNELLGDEKFKEKQFVVSGRVNNVTKEGGAFLSYL